MAIHLLALGILAAIYVVLARGQWFFYDEWDLLAPSSNWDLLAPHNGHLSLGLVAILSLIKSIVGLHAYWPYLLVTIVVHLGVVHLIWRAMNRAAVQPLIALLISTGFGVLAPGSENTLWAFQTGFIIPIGLGLIAFEVIGADGWSARRVVLSILLLGGGILFSSTALPFFAVGVVLMFVKKGWRSALLVGLVLLVPYIAWRIAFVSGPQATDAFGAHGLGDFAARVPAYVVTSLVDSLASIGPAPELAASMMVAFAIWLAYEARNRKPHQLPTEVYLLLVGLVFAVLIGVSRLNIGEDGSAGRYVYFYAAVAAPEVGVALSWAARRASVVLAGLVVGLLFVLSFNVVNLAIDARDQASLEQFTKQSVSAVLALDRNQKLPSDARPLPVLAPTLTVGEIRQFVASGDLTPGSYDQSSLLSDRVNLELQTDPLSGSPALTDCTPGSDGLVLPPGPQHQVELRADKNQAVSIVVKLAGATSAYTRVELQPGVQQLLGFDDATIVLSPPSSGALCIPDFVH